MMLETEEFRADDERSDLFSFVVGSPCLIFSSTFRSLGVPLRAEIVFVQNKLEVS